jgi:Transposase DDE domain
MDRFMFTTQLLFNELESTCPGIHITRLDALLDVASALQRSQNLSLSAMGKHLSGNAERKHKIKKVDRLEGNKHLHTELGELYEGLSGFVFKYITHTISVPIIIDLCFVKDDRQIQMLSAEVSAKGRSIPIYREVFKEGELSGRQENFLYRLKKCLPENRKVIIIMDAGFSESWFKCIEDLEWNWICRVRQGKSIKLNKDGDWLSIKDFLPQVDNRIKSYDRALLMKTHEHICRLITKKTKPKGRKVKVSRGKTTSKLASGSYRNAAKEPWILATNLPSEYKPVMIIKLYSKRMQIEESFRDIKSHQFGLSGRYIRTTCIHRWGVKMLLAAIAQITCWIIGVIGHSQGLQKRFQSNTVKDRKVFSYFTLGQLIINHDELDKLNYHEEKLNDVIQTELAREW